MKMTMKMNTPASGVRTKGLELEALSMAAFLPLSVSLFLPVPVPLLEELHVRKPDIMGTLPIRSIPRRATVLLTFCDSNRNISTNGIYQYQSVESSTRHLTGSLSFYSNVSFYFTNVVLAGYWVGPDVDDGWGFIEAFVDRIS